MFQILLKLSILLSGLFVRRYLEQWVFIPDIVLLYFLINSDKDSSNLIVIVSGVVHDVLSGAAIVAITPFLLICMKKLKRNYPHVLTFLYWIGKVLCNLNMPYILHSFLEIASTYIIYITAKKVKTNIVSW